MIRAGSPRIGINIDRYSLRLRHSRPWTICLNGWEINGPRFSGRIDNFIFMHDKRVRNEKRRMNFHCQEGENALHIPLARKRVGIFGISLFQLLNALLSNDIYSQCSNNHWWGEAADNFDCSTKVNFVWLQSWFAVNSRMKPKHLVIVADSSPSFNWIFIQSSEQRT